jgi:NADH-quinone oxidoreductase subunit D
MEELIHDFEIIVFGHRAPKGEVYHSIEAPKGELGFYIISEGGGKPYRLKIRAPSFCNVSALPQMVEGRLLSDMVTVISSLDPVMGEMDR